MAEAEAPGYRTVVPVTLPFVRDHVVQGHPILPGACLIEMACAALALSRSTEWVARIEDVVFLQPVTLTTDPARLLTRLQAKDGHWHFAITTEGTPSPLTAREA